MLVRQGNELQYNFTADLLSVEEFVGDHLKATHQLNFLNRFRLGNYKLHE